MLVGLSSRMRGYHALHEPCQGVEAPASRRLDCRLDRPVRDGGRATRACAEWRVQPGRSARAVVRGAVAARRRTGSGAGAGSGRRRASASSFRAASLPVIPAVPVSVSALAPRGGVVHQAPASHPVLTASRGTGVAGGAIGGTGGTVVTVGGGGSGGGTAGGSGGSGGSGGGHGGERRRAPRPGQARLRLSPRLRLSLSRHPVDTAVTVVTSVTQQVPAPVGPAVTQTVQAAGSVVDSLIPQTGQP